MALRHASSFMFGLLAVVCFFAGCGHRVKATVQFAPDACGVPVYIDVTVTTEAGAPVSDAEVWRVFDEILTAVKQLPPTLEAGKPWSNYTVRINVVVPPRR
jgi:hypothetical protein